VILAVVPDISGDNACGKAFSCGQELLRHEQFFLTEASAL
jgi:hypothetical protein